MNIKQLRTLEQVADFLHASAALEPVPATQAERYQRIETTLRHFRYAQRSRFDKGLVIVYLGRITGYSRQQFIRLIRRYRDRLRWAADIRLLAEIDALHDTPSGPAVKKLCERAWHRFGDARYQRLAGISVAHLYNLRQGKAYRAPACPHQDPAGCAAHRSPP